MAASPSNPPPSATTPTPVEREHMRDSYTSFIHNTSLAMLVVAPVLIALPPRKLDLYTFILGGAFVASANQVTKERTGMGLLSRFPGASFDLPAKAQGIQSQVQQRRLLEEPGSATQQKKSGSLLEEKAREIWMGGETEGWKERRLREEQEKIEQGEGYGSMIWDQIWEVWNWGEKKAAEIKETDEKILKERRRQEEFPKIGKE